VYFPAPLLSKQGVVLGSRTMRTAFRRAILDFTQIGIPTSKLGIFLGFQTTKGTGGREGLKPASAWFEVVKLQALAAKQVAKEMKFHGIWSWGWAEYKAVPGEVDSDKARAACVYLWTRNPKLCNGPAVAGKNFNRSRTEGQLSLPGTIRCRIDGVGSVTWRAINPLKALTGDPELAFTNAFARTVEQKAAPVTSSDIIAAERSIVAARFGGSRSAYLNAIAQARTSLAVARGVIGDELRHARIESKFRVPAPTPKAIADYQDTYGDLNARLVQAKEGLPWLGGKRSGYALASIAPPQLMTLATGRWSTVWSPLGSARVRPLGPPEPLATLPGANVRTGIRAALMAQAREDRFPAWLMTAQRNALSEAICWRDQMPELSEVDLTNYLPFLAVTG
jgi:hypothetical protein